MGPLVSSNATSTGDVTTSPTRLYGLIVSVSAAHADNLVTLKDSSSGSTLLIINPGDAALGPVVVNMPAESYIRFDTSMHLTVDQNVDSVTFLYQT